MQLSRQELTEIITSAVKETIEQLGLAHVGEQMKPKQEKTAYQKTEQLLYNYVGLKRVVDERMQEIEDIRKYGVPQRSGSIVEYSGSNGGTVHGLVLEEESVENAVRTVQDSVQRTVQVIALVDKCMASLKHDPYYEILPMRYFEGRTQEDISLYFKCTQKTISLNKSRLVKELAMRLFPNQTVEDMMHG